MIRVHDKDFTEFLSATKIQERVTALALQINADYAGKSHFF